MWKNKSIKRYAKTLIKYPGGKDKEISVIAPRLPHYIRNYYEPFFGGGAVYFALNPGEHKFINDLSEELYVFYKCVKEHDSTFYNRLDQWNNDWAKIEEYVRQNLSSLITAFDAGQVPDDLDDDVKSVLKEKFLHIAKKAEISGSVEHLSENIEAAFKQALFQRARKEYNEHKTCDSVKAALYVIMRQYAFSGGQLVHNKRHKNQKAAYAAWRRLFQ